MRVRSHGQANSKGMELLGMLSAPSVKPGPLDAYQQVCKSLGLPRKLAGTRDYHSLCGPAS